MCNTFDFSKSDQNRFDHISVKQRQSPDQQVDSGPRGVQLCENNSNLNSSSGWHFKFSHVWSESPGGINHNHQVAKDAKRVFFAMDPANTKPWPMALCWLIIMLYHRLIFYATPTLSQHRNSVLCGYYLYYRNRRNNLNWDTDPTSYLKSLTLTRLN